jgi:hypothetical protein
MKKPTTVAIVAVLVASLGVNLWLWTQNDSLSQKTNSLTSEMQAFNQGTIAINGTVFDVTALRLNNASNLDEGTVVLFRNITFTCIPNTSNGTRWMEFLVKPVGSHGMPQDLKALWWPPFAFAHGYNEAFTRGLTPVAGVIMKPNDTSYVYLLVSIIPQHPS